MSRDCRIILYFYTVSLRLFRGYNQGQGGYNQGQGGYNQDQDVVRNQAAYLVTTESVTGPRYTSNLNRTNIPSQYLERG